VKCDENDLDSLRLQARQGDAWAQFTLGEMYRKGDGVPQNFTEAARWHHRLAANSICRTADYLLGLMYLKGEGVSKNYAKAFKRFSEASTGGHRAAQECLGRMYENGQGVPKDLERAAWWFGVAAKPETDQREPWYWHGRMDVDGKESRKARDVNFSAGRGLFLMTGPIDDRLCRTCLKHLSLVCTAEEWETIEPAIFTTGLHQGCRCSWRSVRSMGRTLQEMQNTIWLQMDVEKFRRGIYWRPIVVLGDLLKEMD
jgi:hypothetical protein